MAVMGRIQNHIFTLGEGWAEDTPYSELYGEAPPKRCSFLPFSVFAFLRFDEMPLPFV